MARSHHRTKHKEHLRQYKNKIANEGTAKSKASRVLAIGGAVFGVAVAYFATNGDFFWIAIALVVCSFIGYFIGRLIDSGKL